MSRGGRPGSVLAMRFPRVSGDEPGPERALELVEAFSPRERG